MGGDDVFGDFMGTAFPEVHYGLRPNSPLRLVFLIFVSKINKTGVFRYLKGVYFGHKKTE
ncbi:hypothetical protein GCM10027340_00050 [Marinomonas epiphytica]